uniref:Uncharacterized protein n=1 Tax=Lepeophtheirus salmonis TaxID=72036 RepID=A0A0K2TBK7_LEPSM
MVLSCNLNSRKHTSNLRSGFSRRLFFRLSCASGTEKTNLSLRCLSL